jgi:hypothetical protein
MSHAGLYKQIGTSLVQVWTEAEPSAATTWEAFTHNAETLDGTYYDICYLFQGKTGATASNIYHLEVDSITLTISHEPVVALLAAVSPYQIDSKLKNDTTGDYLTISYPAAVDETITIDCDNRTVTHSDGTNIRAAMTLSSTRQEWFTLENGENTISYTELGLTDVDIVMTYAERSL